MSKTGLIPVFPLQLVVFPDEIVNLHIFETRYKQLVAEAEANKQVFGIPSFIEKEPLSWGTEVELKQIVEKYPDGKVDIKIIGKQIFKVDNFIPKMPGRLYSGADISYLDIDREK